METVIPDSEENVDSLDLDIKEVEVSSSPGFSIEKSKTALELDTWSLRKGKEVAQEVQEEKKIEISEFEASDLRGAFYEPEPVLTDKPCEDPLRQEFVRSLLESEDYRVCHPDTMLNEELTELAFNHTLAAWYKLREEHKKPGDEGKKGGGSKEKGDGRDPSNKTAPDETSLTPQDMLDAVRAAGSAARTARKEQDEIRATEDLFGGLGPGGPGSKMNSKKILDLYQRIKKNEKLKRISEHAGKFLCVARARQRARSIHGQDEIIGITAGGEIPRLLPVELISLMDPDLEWEALRRIAERQALCREVRGMEPKSKGPIIIVVDESSSMAGSKEETAKALALSLANVALSQKRWCGLISYTGFSAKGNYRLLPLPPGKWEEDLLLSWMEEFLSGGSNRDVPVVELPDYYRQIGAPAGKTDIIMITDAICYLDTDHISNFNTWRRSVDARTIGLVIKRSNINNPLRHVCDELYNIPAISLKEAAVERVLEI